MNVENIVEVFVGITALVSFVYRISQLESKLYLAINLIEDKLLERVNKQENKLGIHLSNYVAKNEMQDYQIHALNEKLDHKFQRCWDEIKQRGD